MIDSWLRSRRVASVINNGLSHFKKIKEIAEYQARYRIFTVWSTNGITDSPSAKSNLFDVFRTLRSWGLINPLFQELNYTRYVIKWQICFHLVEWIRRNYRLFYTTRLKGISSRYREHFVKFFHSFVFLQSNTCYFYKCSIFKEEKKLKMES